MLRQTAVSRVRTSGVYAAILVSGVLAFLAIRRYGETLSPPAVEEVARSAGAVPPLASDVLLHVLVALAAVVVVGRLLARAFRAIGQPPVLGEVIGGILLGPSLLGRVAPELHGYILPPPVAPFLSVLAQLGVILYMFLVGLELNVEPLRRRVHAAVMTSHASIVVPFVLGSLLALYLYPLLSPPGVPFTSFALFMGIAMSITAFPVLARILSDRGMTRTELGVIALTSAAVDDVTAWCLLAFVVGVVQARMEGALLVAVLTLGFTAVMFLVVKPMGALMVRRLSNRQTGREAIAMALVGLLLAALVSERIGVHAIFGAFLFGAVLPHDTALARSLKERMEDLVTVLLLPAFFAFTGMRTEIGLVSGVDEWLICGLIILVATLGKFGGTLAAARFTGLPWRQATGLGILMNTRGLMELVVLNIGLDLGVISPTLYTMMVLMALVTTMTTTPVLESLGLGRACAR
jgi:Kef-type K+ transport system membrane component KefB